MSLGWCVACLTELLFSASASVDLLTPEISILSPWKTGFINDQAVRGTLQAVTSDPCFKTPASPFAWWEGWLQHWRTTTLMPLSNGFQRASTSWGSLLWLRCCRIGLTRISPGLNATGLWRSTWGWVFLGLLGDQTQKYLIKYSPNMERTRYRYRWWCVYPRREPHTSHK